LPLSHAPNWYGKDIVEKILNFAKKSTFEQEIACHSFSHPMFGDLGCSENLARAEIDKCLEIMRNYKISPTTFVFPVGSVGHTQLLKEKAFFAFCSGIASRIYDQSLEKSVSNLLKKYVHLGTELLSHYFFLSPPLVVPREVIPGLWEVPRSLCFNKKKGVQMDLVTLRAKKAVRDAVEEKKCFHMFTHLHNFGVDAPVMLQNFENILALVESERKRKRLRVVNVKELTQTLQFKT